jgi:uncharacterized protein (DUF433 family)
MRRKLIIETQEGGVSYEYFPITEHIVNAKGVCGGRPTFKYTRLEPKPFVNMIKAGHYTIDYILDNWSQISKEALLEAIELDKLGKLK